jgi:Bacteriocin-protection, YdeI or OmpD-Associated/Domain of unknown function (DUF1905)
MLLIDKTLKIEKFQGKGGWHYVVFEKPAIRSNAPFGWIKASGFVDEHPIDRYKLWPMGKEMLMMALKASIRKSLGKTEGDLVQVRLHLDESPLLVPAELMICLEEFPKALAFFCELTESNKQFYIDWISEAKHDTTKVSRINKMIDKLLEGKKFHE